MDPGDDRGPAATPILVGTNGTVSLSASRYEVLEGDSLSATVNLSGSPAADFALRIQRRDLYPAFQFQDGMPRLVFRASDTPNATVRSRYGA